MENPVNMDDLGVCSHYFWFNTHMYRQFIVCKDMDLHIENNFGVFLEFPITQGGRLQWVCRWGWEELIGGEYTRLNFRNLNDHQNQRSWFRDDTVPVSEDMFKHHVWPPSEKNKKKQPNVNKHLVI